MRKSTDSRYSPMIIALHWLTALILFVILNTGFRAANAAESAKWCPPVDEWPFSSWGSPDAVPDGILVRVGPTLFRSCTSPFSPPGERMVRLTMSPTLLVEQNILESMVSLTISELVPVEKQIANFLRYQKEIGVRKFGETLYREFDYHEITEADSGLSSYFLYDEELNRSGPELPPHYISCPDKARDEGGAVTCFVTVQYRGMIASVLLIGDGTYFKALNRDDFPKIAKAIQDTLVLLDFSFHSTDREWLSLSVE